MTRLLFQLSESLENVAPTVGFCPETLEYRGCEITIYDLGGGSRIRAVWSKYFSEVLCQYEALNNQSTHTV